MGILAFLIPEIVAQINRCHPNFLFVALGFPKQEQWLAKNINNLSVNVFQDVGGSFDVLSGHVKRAPQFYIDHHLEWLYRSLSNPARIGRIFQLPFFIVKACGGKLKEGISNWISYVIYENRDYWI